MRGVNIIRGSARGFCCEERARTRNQNLSKNKAPHKRSKSWPKISTPDRRLTEGRSEFLFPLRSYLDYKFLRQTDSTTHHNN